MKNLYNVEDFTYDEFILFNALSKDKTLPSSKTTLNSLTGFGTRKIKELVKQLRRKNVPVCAQITNGGGYWIEEDKKEFGRFVAQQKTQLDGYKKSYQDMRNIYNSLDGEDENGWFE